MNLRDQMKTELTQKDIFEQAKKHAFQYIDTVEEMDAFPQAEALELLAQFDHPLQAETCNAQEVLTMLHQYGTPNTTAQIAGRYFGFVNGSAVPAALAAKWLSDVWDQNGGLYYTSAINAKLEQVCESWLKDIFDLPDSTVAGFVSGTSSANLCAIAAARYRILERQGWDVNKKGLIGSPGFRIVAHEQVHSSVKRTFAMLGLGYDCVEWIPADEQGRMIVSEMPDLDQNCLLLLQAGNANTGSFDHFDEVCDIANQAGAWIHIDGAFGLWAGASGSLKHLTKGIEKATSWAVDGHKTLNTPYDCGIVLCKDQDALLAAMQATGEYIVYSDQRDAMMYSQEMSKRARAIELWATMKYLGKSGIDELVTGLHIRAKQLEAGLLANGFDIINEVVFNQVLVACDSDKITNHTLGALQESGTIWLGGSRWNDKPVIRVSICSWMTTAQDIDKTIDAFIAARSSF